MTEAFETLGIDLVHTPSALYGESRLGIKTQASSQNFVVTDIYSGSPADMGAVMLGDEIIGVNGNACQGELEGWLHQYDDQQKRLHVVRKGRIIELPLPELNRTFFNTYSIKQMENKTPTQNKAFKAWSK